MQPLPMEGDLPIFYKILTVYQSGLPAPNNDWTKEHIKQGFSWRPGSVSFRTLDPDDINESVLVEMQPDYTLLPTARRVIKVPFEVRETGVAVTSPASDVWELAIPPGNYALFFAIEPVATAEQTEERAAEWRYHVTLVPAASLVEPEILRADEALEPPRELLMVAQPAV